MLHAPKLHRYHEAVPPMAPIALFARATRSTNRSTAEAPIPLSFVTVCNITKGVRTSSAASGDAGLPRLDIRVESGAPNAPNIRGRQRLGE